MGSYYYVIIFFLCSVIIHIDLKNYELMNCNIFFYPDVFAYACGK